MRYKMKSTYITLLSSKEYLLGVLALNKNLKDLKCKYPLTVMVTNDIAEEICPYLSKNQIPYHIVERLYYNQKTLNYWKSLNKLIGNTASKIQLFNLTEYDKIIYIDADSFFLINPDELFNKFDGSICEDIESDSGFSGLFVCSPKNHNFEYYKILLENSFALDGDLFAKLWFPFKSNQEYHIDINWFYNILCITNEKQINEIKGLHFCNKYKPWYYNKISDYINDIQLEWKINCNSCYQISSIYFEKYLNPIRQELDNE